MINYIIIGIIAIGIVSVIAYKIKIRIKRKKNKKSGCEMSCSGCSTGCH